MAGSAPRRSCGPAARRSGDDPGVVAGGQPLEAEALGPLEQPVELDVAVALDAGVGRAPRGVLGDVGIDDVAVNSSVKLKTWWSMPSCWATRRASSTSPTEQQPESTRRPTA